MKPLRSASGLNVQRQRVAGHVEVGIILKGIETDNSLMQTVDYNYFPKFFLQQQIVVD